MNDTAIKKIEEFIIETINSHQRNFGLRDDLTIESDISETSIDDASLVNMLIKVEMAYEIFFEDTELRRTLYDTLNDIKIRIVQKINRREEFLFNENILI